MSGPNQTLRELGAPDGRWVAPDQPAFDMHFLRPSAHDRWPYCEFRLRQDVVEAEELLRAVETQILRFGDSPAMYEHLRVLYGHVVAARRRLLDFLNQPIWIVHPQALDRVSCEPGSIIRLTGPVELEAIPPPGSQAFEQQYMGENPNSSTYTQLSDAALQRLMSQQTMERLYQLLDNLFMAGGDIAARRDGVPCDRCPAVVRPGDSYPVIWVGTKSRAALCEGCFREEESAGRARPCKGLDEEAT